MSCVKDISKKRDDFIILKTKGAINKISINKIAYIEVMRKDIIVHTSENEKYIVKNNTNKKNRLYKKKK